MNPTLKYIEQSLNVKLGKLIAPSGGSYAYSGTLSEDILTELVKTTVLEWQDETAHDCGNGDGMLYVYLPSNEELEEGELFICVDVANNVIDFC
jgi:hypothetical protein